MGLHPSYLLAILEIEEQPKRKNKNLERRFLYDADQ